MNQPTHTPTPWEVDALGYIRGPDSENILEVKENAEFICLVVNSHEELLAAAKNVIDKYNSSPDGPLGKGFVNGDFFKLRDAIANAEKP